MKQLILASASPRRRHLLEHIGLSPRVMVSSVNEQFEDDMPPGEVASTLAMRKAADVAGRVEEGLIIGADTIVEYGGRILEKPRSPSEAVQMLKMLSGKSHTVWSGVALIRRWPDNKMEQRTFTEQTEVTFGELDETDITRYVDSGLPMDKAGAYGIQDPAGALFVKSISGDYNTVVGLPLFALCRHLKSFAPEYLKPVTLL